MEKKSAVDCDITLAYASVINAMILRELNCLLMNFVSSVYWPLPCWSFSPLSSNGRGMNSRCWSHALIFSAHSLTFRDRHQVLGDLHSEPKLKWAIRLSSRCDSLILIGCYASVSLARQPVGFEEWRGRTELMLKVMMLMEC